MEIYIDDKSILENVRNHFLNTSASIKIKSIDGMDNGACFTVNKKDIASIIMDEYGNMLWWKQYSELEGRYFTSSCAFEEYELI